MESNVVMIGSKYRSGASRAPAGPADPARTGIAPNLNHNAPPTTSIYMVKDGQEVFIIGNVQEGFLRRFSKVAREQFPPKNLAAKATTAATTPTPKTASADKSMASITEKLEGMGVTVKSSTHATTKAEKRDSKEENGGPSVNGTSKSNTENWAEAVEEQSQTPSDKAVANSDKPALPTEPKTTPSRYPNGTAKLILHLPVEVLPSAEGFTHIIFWMRLNRDIKMPTPVIPLGPANPSTVPLLALIDTYAAALALGIMPHPTELKKCILDRITRVPSTAKDMETIYARIPHDNPIVTRMVTAYFEHRTAGRIDAAADADIYAYTATQPDLDQKFAAIAHDRDERAARGERTATADQEGLRRAFDARKRRNERVAEDQRRWEQAEARIMLAKDGQAVLTDEDVRRLGMANAHKK